MPLIPIDGRRVHVQTTGRGPTVVMLHGLVQGDLATMYFGLAPRLSDRRRLVMYDLRGHGRSDPAPRGYDLDTLVGDLRSVIEATVPDGEDVDLVGYSYGGTIALRAALDRVPRIRSVTAIDSPRPPFDPADASEAMALEPDRMVRELAGIVAESFGTEVSRAMGFDGPGRRTDRRTERLRRFRSETTLVEDLKREPAWRTDDLVGLEIPVLLIYGADSSFLPTGRWLADHAGAGSRLVVLPGDHYLPVTHRSEVAGVIDDFLDG